MRASIVRKDLEQPRGVLVIKDVHGVVGPAGRWREVRMSTLAAARRAAKVIVDPPCYARRAEENSHVRQD